MPFSTNTKHNIAGFNVYQNNKGQNILYLKRNKCGYIIQEKDENSFILYHNRVALAIALFMLLASLLNVWQLPLVIAAVFLLLLEIRYRFSWLPSLTRIENYHPDEPRNMVNALVQSDNKARCILLFILYLALGILLVIYEFQQNASIIVIVGAFLVLAVCLYMAVNYLRAIIKMS